MNKLSQEADESICRLVTEISFLCHTPSTTCLLSHCCSSHIGHSRPASGHTHTHAHLDMFPFSMSCLFKAGLGVVSVMFAWGAALRMLGHCDLLSCKHLSRNRTTIYSATASTMQHRMQPSHQQSLIQVQKAG